MPTRRGSRAGPATWCPGPRTCIPTGRTRTTCWGMPTPPSRCTRRTSAGSPSSIFRLYWLDPAHLAEIYEALGRNYEFRGQADSSAKYYQALLTLWENAEPALAPKRNAVRDALARVSGEKGMQVPLGAAEAKKD